MPLPRPRYLTQPKVCLLTDYPTHHLELPVVPRRTGRGARTRGQAGTTGLLGAPRTRSRHHTRTARLLDYTQGGLRPQLGPRGRGVWPPPWWPRPSWVPSSWAAEGGGRWGGPQARKGDESRLVRGGTGAGGAGRLHSRDCNISNCLSTFVWLVSRISPARNISSTTV